MVRVNGHEYGLVNGLTMTETARAAALIEEAGADAIHISANAHNPFADFTEGPLPSGVAQYREMARTVKAHVTIPVVAVGRVLPEVAEDMIAKGECDFVSMGRQLLADPDLVNKIRAGQRQSIRPCINCYVCVEQNFFDGTPKCAVNPALGHETRAILPPLGSVRRVTIIGAGPAGLESARVLAERGADVTVIDKSDRLGGTVWFSQLTTPANAQLVDWLSHEVQRLKVTIRLGEIATAAMIAATQPDAVIVATGAKRGRPDVPGADLAHVLTGDILRGLITGEAGTDTSSLKPVARRVVQVGRVARLLNNPERIRTLSKRWMPVGKRVVVIGGGLVGLELSEFLAERGRNVTVLESGAQMGLPMAMPRRWTAVNRAARHGVTLIREATVISINNVSVRYRIGNQEFEVRANTVVLAGDVTSDRHLADELVDLGVPVHVIGDALDIGYIEGAIHTAQEVAREL
jgi:NADPH-dependent 2,4-dienoyl-CoA reductase/sulfur reductase-like enzyme